VLPWLDCRTTAAGSSRLGYPHVEAQTNTHGITQQLEGCCVNYGVNELSWLSCRGAMAWQ
jgi:hypothetical protein